MIPRFLKGLVNCFKIPELRKRILFTLGIIAVYRVGCYIPTPGINGQALSEYFQRVAETTGGSMFTIMNMFSGRSLEKNDALFFGCHALHLKLDYYAAFDSCCSHA